MPSPVEDAGAVPDCPAAATPHEIIVVPNWLEALQLVPTAWREPGSERL